MVKFAFRKLPKFAHWWIVIEPDGSRILCLHNPRLPIDLDVTTDLRSLSEFWTGDIDLRLAKETGRLQLTGNPTLIRTIASWLRPGIFSYIRPQSG